MLLRKALMLLNRRNGLLVSKSNLLSGNNKRRATRKQSQQNTEDEGMARKTPLLGVRTRRHGRLRARQRSERAIRPTDPSDENGAPASRCRQGRRRMFEAGQAETLKGSKPREVGCPALSNQAHFATRPSRRAAAMHRENDAVKVPTKAHTAAARRRTRPPSRALWVSEPETLSPCGRSPCPLWFPIHA